MKWFLRSIRFRNELFLSVMFLISVGITQYFLGPSLIALILKVATISILCYLFVKQFQQAVGPEDGYTRLRWRIFSLICFVIIFLVPSIWLQVMNYMGLETGKLNEFVTVSTNLSILGFAILLLTTRTYKPSEGVEK